METAKRKWRPSRIEIVLLFGPLLLLVVWGVWLMVESRRPHPLATLEIDEDVGLAAISRDGGSVAVTNWRNPKTIVWQTATGRRTTIPLTASIAGVYPHFALSGDGGTLAVHNEKNLQVWDATFGTLTRTTPATGNNLIRSFSVDNEGRVVCSYLPDWLKLYSSIGVSPDGKTFAAYTLADGGKALLYDMKTRYVKLRLPHPRREGRYFLIIFSPDNRTLATSFGDVRVWDYKTGRRRFHLPQISDAEVLAFSPDAKILAVGTYHYKERWWGSDLYRGEVTLWDTQTGHLLQAFDERHHGIENLLFSGDGRTLAIATDATVKLWDISHLRPS